METITQPQNKKSLYKDFVEITKARLSISVVISTIAGYLLGFNQERGEVYTIFNLHKVLNLVLHDKTDFEKVQIDNESNMYLLTVHRCHL